MNRALGLQEHVFWLLDRVQPMNVVGVAQVAGPVPPAALARALAAAAAAEPLLDAAFAPGAARLVSAVGPVPLRVERRDDGDHWRRVAECELARRFAPGAPLARVVLLAGAGRSDLLVVLHHAVADGFSSLLFLRALLAGLDPAAPPPSRAPERPVLEALLPPGSLPEGVAPTVEGAQQPGAVPAPRWRPRLVQFQLEMDEVAALAARCRREETTVNGALCAAFLLAAAAAGAAGGPLACTCPVNVRGRLDPPLGDAFGLFISEAATVHRLGGGEPFWEVARAARAGLERAIGGGRMFRDQARLNASLAGTTRLATLAAEMDRYAPAQLGLTNLGRIDFPTGYGELRVEAMHFASMPPVPQPLLSVATFGGVMTANFLYPDPYLSAADAAALAADVAARLRAATASSADGDRDASAPAVDRDRAAPASADLDGAVSAVSAVSANGDRAASAGSPASNGASVNGASVDGASVDGASVDGGGARAGGVPAGDGRDALAARLSGLSEAKRRLLVMHLAAAAPEEPAWEDLPLSHGQRAMWFLHGIAPESVAYTQPFAARIPGGVSADAMRRALAALMQRHDVLRATFPAPGGAPVQRIHRHLAPPLEVVDAAGWSGERLRAAVDEAYARPFCPAQAPPWRAFLFRGGEDDLLLITLHHLVFDLWSLVVLVDDLRALYAAERDGRPAALPPPAARYADFVRAEAGLLASPAGERMRDYWLAQAAGVPPLELPADHARPAVQGFRGEVVRFTLGAERARGLRELARAHGVTLFTAVVAVAQAFLHRWSGQERFAVGSPTAGRRRPELARVVGDFVNPVLLAADFSGDPTFSQHLHRARQVVLGALAHQEYPFPLLVERLQPSRDPSRPPLIGALVALHNQLSFVEQSLGGAGAGALALEPVEVPMRGAQADLALELREMGDALEASLTYDTALFTPATAGRMRDGLLALLDAALARPAARISDLPLLSAVDAARLLAEANPPPWSEPPATALALVAAQAGRTPHAGAATCGAQRLSYADLAARAGEVAAALRRRGVRRGHVVGLAVERTAAMPAALLGIWRAGAAYLPLDPAYPPERLRHMLADSGVRLVLADASSAPALRALGAGIVDLDGIASAAFGSGDGTRPGGGNHPESPTCPGEAMRSADGAGSKDRTLAGDGARSVDGPAWADGFGSAEGSADAEAGWPAPDDLAYVIYTSGSTGLPKGVEVHHGAVASFLRAFGRAVPLAAGDVLAAVTTPSFDISVLELLGPLAAGARVEVVGREEAADGAVLARRLAASGATVMQATPSSWRLLLDAGWAPPPGFRALCGGEALPADLAARLLGGGGALWNLYGPTEATVWSTAAPLAPGQAPVPVGRPLANTRAYVLDPRGRPLPAGVPGELWLGGAGVARGYRGRPALTAQRFAPDPFSPVPGARMYATGDRARLGADGALYCLGRLDQQVKVRGVRVEPGEVEAALRRHPAVRDAAVVLREPAPGDARLTAYVESADPPPAAELRAHLRGWLPEAMLPSVFVPLAALPRTPNGKLDRAALPAPDAGAVASNAEPRVPPRGETERRLAAIWREVLGCGEVGAHQSFFDLGGHSLLLPQVQARIRAGLGAELSVVDLLRHPTVAMLAERLERGAAPAAAPAPGAMDRVRERARLQLAALERAAAPGRAP